MKELFKIIKSDLDPNNSNNLLKNILKFIFNMPFRLILNYRVGHYLQKNRNGFKNIILLWLKKRQLNKYACDISYQAIIGKNVKFTHPIGVIIGYGSVIGDNVMIWQHVTLGSDGKSTKSFPIIKDNVKLYSQCQIIGGVTVGMNSKVAASAVLLKDLPENKSAVGIPAKIID